MPPRNLAVILLTAIISLACYLKAERNRYAAQLAEAMKVVGDLYVDEVDQRELFENAMGGMVEGLDQYSSYIEPELFKQMEQSLDQEFGGVGIEVEKEADEKPILVLSPLFDSPGYRAGLRAGDKIMAIDGESTIGMKSKDAIEAMRGPPGSKVLLLVRHATSPDEVEIEVERAVIRVNSLLGDTRKEDGTWDFHLREDPRIGYLRLTSFGKHTADELGEALGGSERIPFEAVLLDVRNNAGGLLDSAVETCDLFIERGKIVSTRGRDGKDRSVFEASPSIVLPKSVPLVVLVNRYSASASEILAACLQDHGRAVIVGERTWGKGTVQNLFPLEGGRSALKLTTATYWRPSGQNIHRTKDAPESEAWGVQPNPGFEVKFTDEQIDGVIRARRERDLQRVPGRENGGSPTEDNPPATRDAQPEETEQPTEASSPAEDPDPQKPKDGSAIPPAKVKMDKDLQLERAIQYLQQQLDKKPVAAAA